MDHLEVILLVVVLDMLVVLAAQVVAVAATVLAQVLQVLPTLEAELVPAVEVHILAHRVVLVS